METLELTKELIKIPSFVDSKNNESKLGQWIYDYLKNNSKLAVEKEYVSEDRFNVISCNDKNPNILISGHIDTVQPNKNWGTNPFEPIEKDGRIYGLGSGDMKAGIAVLLSSACQKTNKKVVYLFYCDEEYDFLGMKKFIVDYKNKIKPKIIVSADGGAREIGNACRGLIELTIKVTGKPGHSANPESGINAITKSNIVIRDLEKWLKRFQTPELGKSTLNIAYILGGTNTGNNLLSKEGNIIPNYCEYVVEIRVASRNLSAKVISEYLYQQSVKQGLKVEEIKVRHDLGSWTTPVGQLKNIIKLSPTSKILNAKNRGYIDIQMLWEAFGKVPCFSYGVGSKNTAHKENEYVEIKNIKKAEKFYRNLISNSKVGN